MKNTEIIKLLKSNKDISDFELTIVDKDSSELYYVLKNLEINRSVKTKTTSINVYVDVKEFRGTSTIVVTAGDDVSSLTKKIKNAVKQAKNALNPYFPLTDKTENYKGKKINANLNEIASKAAESVFKADVYKDGWINSTEIFVTKSNIEFINSNGVHHFDSFFNIGIEVIPTWSNNKEEFESYKYYDSSTVNYNEITKEIEEILLLSKERSVAKTIDKVKLPKNIKILIKGDMRRLLAENFADDICFRNVYNKMNHYSIGDKIGDDNLQISLLPFYKGAVSSKNFDANGVLLKKKNIIKNGVVKSNWGGIMYGYYLKSKNITGSLPIVSIDGTKEDYLDGKYLVIEHFSSPQLEEASGYFGGEVRLARYFDGKKFIPLTGFSISGNIYELSKKITFSDDKVVESNYVGPKYMIFKGLSIH